MGCRATPRMVCPFSSGGNFSAGKTDSLEYPYRISHHAGFSYYGSGSMVDGKGMTDGGPRVDIYTCFAMRHFGNHSRNKGNTQTV